MKLFRKGISPLIATVLIIGFTVALAAIIMTWGTTFSKSMQKNTEATTEEQLSCANDVNIDLSSACVNNTPSDCYGAADSTCSHIKLTIKNDGSKALQRVAARFYKNANIVASQNIERTDGAALVESYGLRTLVIPIPPGELENKGEEVTLVEIIPVIKVGEKELTCAAVKDYFGDQNYEDPLVTCGI